MLRHTFCVRSALGHFRSVPLQTATRLLHDNNSHSTSEYESMDHKLNKLRTDMVQTMDDKLKAHDDRFSMQITSLSDKSSMVSVEIKSLSMEIKSLSMEIKNLATTVDARFTTVDGRFEISDAKTQSKLDGLRVELKDRETRFWSRAIFTVLAVAGLTSSAAFLQYQNRAIQAPAVGQK